MPQRYQLNELPVYGLSLTTVSMFYFKSDKISAMDYSLSNLKTLIMQIYYEDIKYHKCVLTSHLFMKRQRVVNDA